MKFRTNIPIIFLARRTIHGTFLALCNQINEISFELWMETVLMLMMFAVLLWRKKSLKNSGLNGSGFESRSGQNFSGLSFAIA